MMEFGKGPIVIFVLFVLSGLVILSRDTGGGETLEFWVFAHTHYDEYAARVPAFEAAHPGVTVDLKIVANLHEKLLAAFLSDIGAPDLVEVEISSVGRFFKGPLEDLGFVDLTDRIDNEGWNEQLVHARLAPWSLNGRTYGLPHDIHPVVLLYRDDVFRGAGIEPDSIETWQEFVEAGQAVTKDTDGDGEPDQYPLMLSTHEPGHFWLMLLQRGGGMFDASGRVIIDDPLAIETLAFYCDLLNGIRVAVPAFSETPANYAAMKEGLVTGVLAADWYVGMVRKFVPELAGKWRAMPLPAWQKGGRRTSTWGGTMIGLTQQSRQRELAWEFMKFVYFDTESLANRYRATAIIPPLKRAWDHPVFDEPDPYLGSQQLGIMFKDLAPDIPSFHLNPYWAEASDRMRDAVFAATMGEKTPEMALQDLADEIRELMK